MISRFGGKTVRAFVPPPLPPTPAVRLDKLQRLLDNANQALGRLDGLASLLPDLSLFIYTYVRKEAVLSSQIEGTQSSLSDLLLFESDETPGVPKFRRRGGVKLRARDEPWFEAVAIRLSAFLTLDPRDPWRTSVRQPRKRKAAGRISDQPKLDRWDSAGQCRFRTSAA